MSEKNILETFLQNGIAPYAVAGTKLPAIVIGSEQKLVDLEGYLEAPLSIKEQRSFDDLRGFIGYVNDYKTDVTAAFASRTRVQVVFDYHGKDSPQWGNHSITFNYTRSKRWELWDRRNNEWMGQGDFADFLDSGLQEITKPSQVEVLAAIKNFRATINAECDSEISEQGTQFTYRQTVKGSTKKTDLTLPEYLTIQVAPFTGLQVLNVLLPDGSNNKIPVYAFNGKLSWRMKQTAEISKPDFKVQLLNFDTAIDETLEAVRGALHELTGVTTYIGG